MKKTKMITCLLSLMLSLGLLCSCEGKIGPQGEQGPQGIQGPQGEQGPAGKDGSSFLTGKGQPSNALGNVGDSYLDIEGEEWGFYIKNEDGWKLLGFIEAEPAPPTLSDFNGSYALSHIVTINVDGTKSTYNIGDDFFGIELTSDMYQIELKDGTGSVSFHFDQYAGSSNTTYTLENNKIIIICETPLVAPDDLTLKNRFEFSIVENDDIYLRLASNDSFIFFKKTN